MTHDMRDKIMKALEEAGHEVKYPNREWIGMKCPFCEDGKSKSKFKVHFNMLLSTDRETNIIIGNCFLPGCELQKPRRLTDKDFSEKFRIRDKEILKWLRLNSNGSVKRRDMDAEDRVSGYKCERIISRNQLDYINKRSKARDPYKFFDRYNLITQFKAFAEDNKDLIPTSTKMKLETLSDEDYIGFLNRTGSQIYIRLMDENKREHVRLPLVKDFKNTNSPSVYERDFDEYNMSIEKPTRIFITEGIWNVINLAEVFACDESGIFVSTGSYKSMLPMWEYLSMKYYNVEWVFVLDLDVVEKCMDSDRTPVFKRLPMFKYMKDTLGYRFKSPILIIWNKASSDVGDLSKPIDIQMERVDLRK